MELPPSDRFRDVFRQRVWTLDRMAVIHLQSAYRSFLYTLLRSSLNTPLILPRPLLHICHFHTHRISVLLIVSPSPDVVFKGSPCSSIFFCGFTGVVLLPYCTAIITALHKGVFFQPLAVEFVPPQQVSIICLDIGSLSHTAH